LDNLTINYEKRRHTGERNEIYWGGGFQQYWDDTYSSRFAGFTPADCVYRVGDVVFRDELQLIPDRLLASAGMRIDYSSWTRFEFQPSFRLLYTPSRRQSAWMAISRAARIPSRFERGIESDRGQVLMSGLPIQLGVFGSTAVRSATERSVEAGYRLQSGQRWSFDEAVFWSYYDHLRALALPRQPTVAIVNGHPTFNMRLNYVSAATGRSYGSETAATWQVMRNWRLIPAYTYLNEARWLPNPPSAYGWDFLSSGSRHQGLVRSQHDFSHKLQFDLMARARSRNVAFNLPGVLLADARLGWRPARETEFSLSIQNLTGRTVVETFSEGPFVAIPLRRTFVFKWTQRF
jgi:iron complex outermembrane receptor protein